MESNVARVMSSEALEIARLKMKTNKLIDANEQLIKEKEQLQETIQRLQRIEGSREDDSGISEEDRFTFLYIKRIFRFISDLKRMALWLDYKNNTANTKEYYRIEKRDFETILATYTNEMVSAHDLIHFMVNLGILKSSDSKEIFSVIVAGKSRRVYMVRKTAVDLPGVQEL